MGLFKRALMKIAFLTHEPFYPPSGGGSAEAIYLVQELIQRGHQLHLFCPKVHDATEVTAKFKAHLHEFTVWEMGRYTRLRNFKYLLYPSFLRRMVEHAAREFRFDLVLSQHAISAVAAGWLKNRLRVPVVMNFLDYLTGFMEAWPPYLAPPPLLRLLKKFELSLPIRYRADGLLTVSDTLADYFANAGYPREKIRPIYYGYDGDLFRFHEPPQAQPGPPVIVMHGSLDHHHLRDIAFDSVCFVASHRRDVIFRIVGQRTGALEQFLKRVRVACPDAIVETPGFVPYHRVADHLAGAAVGIVPYEESTGTHCAFVAKIVEYLALGLPVVSTPLDSAKRYFGKEPRVRFSEFDGTSFGRAILSWLDESPSAWLKAARAASERVQRELDWRAISRRAAEFIEGIRA